MSWTKKIDPVVEAMIQIERLESPIITRHDGGSGDTYVSILKGPEQKARDLKAAQLLRQTYDLT